MFQGIWNYLLGYVIIEITGRSLEKAVNLLNNSGIRLWRVRRTNGSLHACVTVEGFYSLRALLRGRGYGVHILEKRGLIMALSRLRFRKVLLYGWIVVAALLLFASRYVWFIKIEGCDRVKETEIMHLLETRGVTVGAERRSVLTYSLGGELMRADERIAWAGARLNGVVLWITVEESTKNPSTDLPDGPASVYAVRDGVIKRITVLDGQARFNAGDAVRAGDELISGVIYEPGYYAAHARGEVIADVLYRFGGEAGPQLCRPVRTGKTSEFVRISLFGYAVDSNRKEYGAEDITITGVRRMENCFLPIIVETLRSYELVNSMVTASLRELEEEALRRAQSAMMGGLPKDVKLLSKETEILYLDNGAVRAVITLTVEENIGETRGIDE